MKPERLVNQPTAAPTRKMNATGGGLGVGAALGSIIVWLLSAAGIAVPPQVDIAIVALLTAGIGWGSGYMTREKAE